MATVLSFRWNGGMQEFGRVPFVSCGQGRKTRVKSEGGQRCPHACYLPRRGAKTICTADNRGTNSTAPEYSAPATHHPGACCPGGLSQVRACAKVLSVPRLRGRFRHGIRQRQGARALEWHQR